MFFRTLLTALVLLLPVTPINAEILTQVNLDPIVITPKRVAEGKGTTVENITVYTEGDISELPAKNLGDILTYIPGVDISFRKFGQATSLSIHGSSSNQVLLMVDGIPFNTQLSGQANPSRLPVEHIKQIEVIKGAASSAWGSSLGGVINVITKDVGDTLVPKGKLKSTFGEFETLKDSLELAGRVGDLGYFMSGSFMTTDGTRSHADVEELKTFTKVSHPIGDLAKITGSFGYSGADVRDGITPTNRINDTPYIARYGQLSLDIDRVKNNFNIAYKYNDQDIKTDIYNATTGARVSSTVSNNVYQGMSLNNRTILRDEDVLVVGADFDWHRFKANNFLDSGKSISMQSPYVNYTLNLGDWDIVPGVRYDNNQRFGSQLSPSIGAVYHVPQLKKTRIRFKAAQAFNAPPLLWIFNSDPALFTAPNPDLKAERAVLYEVGLETEVFSPLKMEFNFYTSDVKDGIVTSFNSSSSLFFKENVNKIHKEGAELLLDYQATEDLNVFGTVAFNNAKNKETGDDIRDETIVHQGYTLGTKYKNKQGYGAHIYGYYYRWNSKIDDEANDAKFIFDAKLSKEFKNVKEDVDVELFLNIYNITNSKYWANVTFPLPKRYFEGGFSVNF